MQTPLLASDGHDEPALSGGPDTDGLQEGSALSRLIAESTPPEALMPFSAALSGGTMIDETTTNNNNGAETPQQKHKPASLTTILAGTFLCLNWGFLWGAFFSNSWMDSHLQVTLSWQQQFLPFLNQSTDFVVQGTSVFSLASDLMDDKNYGGWAGLWICSMVIPCIFMIVCPIWILSDYSVVRWKQNYRQQEQSRLWLELSIRLSLLVAFIILILDVAIGGIELEWEETNLQVHNQLRGAYMSYLLGCTCALLAVVILRLPHLQHIKLLRYPGTASPASSQRQQQIVAESDEAPAQATHAPPANAFRLPWLSSSVSNSDGETESLVAQDAPIQQPQPQSASSLTGMEKWQKWTLFQAGLLSFACWIPSLALANFRVLYAGMVVELVKTPAFSVYVWQLPRIIWHSGVRSGTPKWILIVSFVIVTILVVILPLLAQMIAFVVWMVRPGRLRSVLLDILQILHPALCGIPFSIAIFVTVPSFIDIGENLDQAVCTSIEGMVQNQCLISGGVRLAGCWFLVVQSLALEAFVFLTLRWTAPKLNRNVV